MEWWRKLAIVISIACFVLVTVSSVTLVMIGGIHIYLLEAIAQYLVIGFLTIFIYGGQFEGHDHFKTNKLSKVMAVICFPSLVVFGAIANVISWVIEKFKGWGME